MPNPKITRNCPDCGSQVAPALLSCPSCHRLIHTELLNRLSKEAENKTNSGDIPEALSLWRQALDHLPPKSKQYQIINNKITRLSDQVGTQPRNKTPAKKSAFNGKKLGAVGVFALLAWKLKFALIFLLTKAKLLFLGFTKMSTLFSMILSLGVYWAAWGWKFALGIILSIYIHEMGHVAALRNYGIKASAPMFIPGVGAFVQMHQRPTNPRQDAVVGLAGPWWGIGAAIIAYGVSLNTGWPSWAAIAKVGAWITLFNLLPIWQLDGSRGFAALSTLQRWCAVLILALMWVITKEGMLVLLILVAGYRAFTSKVLNRGNWDSLVSYCSLAIIASLMTLIPVQI